MKRATVLLFACAWSMAAGDVTGKWDFTAQAPNGREYKLELVLKNQAGKLAGSMSSPSGTVVLQDVQISGEELTYKVPAGEVTYTIKLKVGADSMKGTFAAPDGATGPVTVSRAVAAGDLRGKWNVVSRSSGGREYKLLLELKQESGKWGGSLTADTGSVPLQDTKLEGKELSFKLTVDDVVYTVKLTASDGGLKGSYTGSGGETGSVVASRP